jgi:hypothetical protein
VNGTIKVDQSRFNRSWAEYIKLTSRSFVQAVNDKLFMVARQALWRTHKADKKSISKSLGKIVFLRQKNYTRLYRHTLAKGSSGRAPLAALIINKRQGKKNEKGLYGAAMRHAIQVLIGARNVSVAYIKSAWLPAIQTLAKVSSIRSKNVRDDKAARQIGRPKGRAVPAKQIGNVISGMIENQGFAKRDKKGAFEKYGGAGLQAGFDAEAAEMDKYIEGKMKPAADRFNAAQR